MVFDRKIVVILRDNLAVWQKLNVTAFLMSGIGATQEITGESYVDGSGVRYLPMSQQPVMVYASDGSTMNVLLQKALAKEIPMTIYTEELFRTYNDVDNRAKVAEYATENLNLVGLCLCGKKNHVDKLTKGLQLHA